MKSLVRWMRLVVAQGINHRLHSLKTEKRPACPKRKVRDLLPGSNAVQREAQ